MIANLANIRQKHVDDKLPSQKYSYYAIVEGGTRRVLVAVLISLELGSFYASMCKKYFYVGSLK